MKIRELMSRNPTTVGETEDLATALQVMLWTGARHLPVVDAGRLVGVLSHHDLLAKREPGGGLRLSGLVGDAMTAPAFSVEADETLETAAAKMSVDRLGCLPVVDGNELVGIVTITDLLAQLATDVLEFDQVGRTAQDVMTGDPIFTTRDQLLNAAAELMFERRIRHLPVLDDHNRVIGMLSDRDVRSAFGNPLLASLRPKLRVEDAMSHVASVSAPTDSVSTLKSIFLDTRVGAIPVVDADEKLVGIVSYLDVLREVP
jgi:CBS domain-containing protein